MYSSVYHYAYNIKGISQIFSIFGSNYIFKSHFEMPYPNNRTSLYYLLRFYQTMDHIKHIIIYE